MQMEEYAQIQAVFLRTLAVLTLDTTPQYTARSYELRWSIEVHFREY